MIPSKDETTFILIKTHIVFLLFKILTIFLITRDPRLVLLVESAPHANNVTLRCAF